MLEFEPSELVVKPVNDFTHPDDRVLSSRARESLAANGGVVRFEKRCVAKSGKAIWVDISTSAVFDTNGQTGSFSSTFVDITERRQAEEALRESEIKLRAILDASRDANGQWILSPHPEAQSEARWAGVVAGSLRTVQVDRVFRAGLTTQSEGNDAWWIVSALWNPANLVRGLVIRLAGTSVTGAMKTELIATFYSQFIQCLGCYLIEMYSGRLRPRRIATIRYSAPPPSGIDTVATGSATASAHASARRAPPVRARMCPPRVTPIP